MKNLITILLCIIIPRVGNCISDYKKIESPSNIVQQSPNSNTNQLTITFLQWSDPGAFVLSRSPLITGYGTYSDSLSNLYRGKTFYEYNDEYYIIESWADYYYWFTKKYSYMFKNPELYEIYYLSSNNFGMASYIASQNFLGKKYPSLIKIDFLDSEVELNKLADEKYLAINTKDQTRLESKYYNKEHITQQDNVVAKNKIEIPTDNMMKNDKNIDKDIVIKNHDEIKLEKPVKPTLNKGN